MKNKNTIFLRGKEQDVINEFTKLISDICIKGKEEECAVSCYFAPLCPFTANVMDNFCELWDKIDIDVRKED